MLVQNTVIKVTHEETNRQAEKMTAGGTANQAKKWSDKAAGEEEGGLKIVTVECLRGRLLAERTASRNAKQEAQQIQNKLAELEKSLKEETKSRNRAEKKLNSLMKKMKSLNLSYSIDECENSASSEKSEISSSSSSSVISDGADSNGNTKLYLLQNVSQNFPVEIHVAESIEPESGEKKLDDNGLKGLMKEEDSVDNSLALVVVEMGKKKQAPIDPEILDANVKQVMDALKHAKEKLQTSIDSRRRMIQVG